MKGKVVLLLVAMSAMIGLASCDCEYPGHPPCTVEPPEIWIPEYYWD